jgi:hypothetical protein
LTSSSRPLWGAADVSTALMGGERLVGTGRFLGKVLDA